MYNVLVNWQGLTHFDYIRVDKPSSDLFHKQLLSYIQQ